jgi:hypothetical protein
MIRKKQLRTLNSINKNIFPQDSKFLVHLSRPLTSIRSVRVRFVHAKKLVGQRMDLPLMRYFLS